MRTPNLQSRALKAPERARNLLAKGEQLLSGRTMFVSSTLDADLLTQLQRVVSLAGGTALLMNSTAAALNDPTTSGDLILLTDDAEEAKRYLQFGFQNVLNTSWLMDSVAVVSCLDTEQYRWRADLDSKRFEMATSV